MLNSKQVDILVEQVKDELKKEVNYSLTPVEEDELKVTGRTCIDFSTFAPHLKQAQKYINAHNNPIWELSLNLISDDIEITIKCSQIML
ncbi:hypothetical protein LMB96_01725 [Limosilactobacillus reuteri]|uniref:hypothetical protein n=1 Tax=Limosilactobacillus reuteri TaxID=1598 RepID=UPI001E2EA2F6|nr:hypothetical protein [Limosilactobacillus reuteri]MCC4421080.1 hypothetical protein [Limosilactobacillus reuteri]